MAALCEQEKQAIVVLLAQFHRPSEVVVHMREHFGVDVTRFQVRCYDPTNSRYEAGSKWRAIFDAARAAHLGSIEDVPIAHKGYRLNELQKLFDSAKAMGNISLACAILRQAAWETKGISFDKSIASSSHANAPYDPAAMLPEERRFMLREMLEEALSKRSETAVPIAA